MELGLTKDLATKMSQQFNITGITLLSIEEVENLPKDILSKGEWWWLRSPGFGSDNAVIVRRNGSVNIYGWVVNDPLVCACPALRISNLQSFDLNRYDTIQIFDLDWIVIDRDLVLLDGDLGVHPFDTNDNTYETSEIKKYLEDWLVEQKNKFNM